MKKIGLYLIIVVLIIQALMLFACTPSKGESNATANPDSGNADEYRNSVPDPKLLKMTLPGSESYSTQTLGQMAALYDETVDCTRDVNENVLWMLSIIDEIISYDPTSCTGNVCEWGPWISNGLSPIENLFIANKTGENSFQYTLNWRSKDSAPDDPYVVVWQGFVNSATSTQRRGVGQFTIDFTTAQTLDPTIDTTGVITVPYDTLNDGRQIQVSYDQVYDKSEDMPGPIDAEYFYHNHADNTGKFILTWVGDIHWKEYHGTQYPAAEHNGIETRWMSDGQGRSDMLVIGGDLTSIPVGDSFISQIKFSECWDSGFGRTYYSELVVLQDGSEYLSNDSEGYESSCVFQAEFPEVK